MALAKDYEKAINDICKELSCDTELEHFKFCCLWNRAYALRESKGLQVDLTTHDLYIGNNNYYQILLEMHKSLTSSLFSEFLKDLRTKLTSCIPRMHSGLLEVKYFK